MRVSRATLENHRRAILDAAGRLFRRGGLERVTLAEVTREAGLTHGAFYGHYPSKTALAEAACRDSLECAAAKWRVRAAEARAAGADPVAALVHRYLTERHRDEPGGGCALVALGAELCRGEPGLREALSIGTRALLAVLEEEIAPRRPALDPDGRRRAALATLAAMAGGLQLARACGPDPELSREALEAAALLAVQAADTAGAPPQPAPPDAPDQPRPAPPPPLPEGP
ncbi:TetR/AcrR family transcriptional regulator [Roseomonas sp. NAR14]|uniref:TetR/AcrR family transcriptional regulator n=1 Tax=Roseomonas acroporae TaxID=2937791 RepID=A0A9X1YBL5_9PROT|nr:TetR/AcrR family transcriptional regulator [Roseomonas acroporae]MCK8787789.1 TetR/AcrR family transcriptional regulator [Roseomonas acroporae]